MGKKKYTDEEKEYACELARAGRTNREIANAIGCSCGTVQDWCSRAGISRKQKEELDACWREWYAKEWNDAKRIFT